MADKIGVIGIELGQLEELLRGVVRQEMAEVREDILKTLVAKRDTLLMEERLSVDQVAEILGVSRHTIYNYRKSGDLPEPQRGMSGRPYWTPDQLNLAMRRRGIKANFPV